MTREQTKALMPVLVAWSEGRDVQNRHRNHTHWSDETQQDPNFEAEGFEWRVKPTPREFWVVRDGDLVRLYDRPVVSDDKQVIHVREVVE